MAAKRARLFLVPGGLGLAALIGLGLVWGGRGSRWTGPATPVSQALSVLDLAWEEFTPRGAGPANATGPAPTNVATALDDAQRRFLWQVEHEGLVLVKDGFKPLARAIQSADEDALAGLLAEDFRGHRPSAPRETLLETPAARVVRREDDGTTPGELSGPEFIETLLSYRRRFDKEPEVKVALKALCPEDRGRLDGPWRGTCVLRIFGDRGIGQPGEVTLGLSYRINRPDASTLAAGGWLRDCAIASEQVAESDRTLWREVAAERGLNVEALHDNWKLGARSPDPITGGAYLADFDRDGRIDVLVTDLTGYTLYRGLDSGRFEEVTARLGLPRTTPVTHLGQRLTAAVADLDGDGWEDLIVGDLLYRNDEGRAFQPVPPEETSLVLPTKAASVVPADFDRDGFVDLYVTRSGKSGAASWIDGTNGANQGNQLWRNLGGWRFQDVTESAGAGWPGHSVFTALWLDADSDGWPDLYLPNEFGNGTLLVNRSDGTFAERALIDHPCDFGTMGATCGDFDNDGHIDIYAANMYSKAGHRVIGNLAEGTYPDEVMARMRRFVTGSQLHRNRGGLAFEQVADRFSIAAVGWAYGAALFDIDNDGFLDLYATAGFISQTRDKPDG